MGYELIDMQDTYNEANRELLYNDVASEMLKDTGIRTKIIREYLPVMNALINKYLQVLEFFVSFHLNESFEESIKSRHRDKFVYDNFSEGEKMRIDLSLLFAWRQIAKMKNSTNTNLLILDETFDSSLDEDGVDNLMKILKTLDKGTNTFIISHKPDMLESKLQDKIVFIKKNNFSSIE
jgi:DNA repair exonuclease SbcCD ATPase subunit